MKVRNLFDDVKIALAECVFDCACQIPLNYKDTILIINFLKNNCQVIQSSLAVSNNSSLNVTLNQTQVVNQTKQSIEHSHLYLIMSVLYCFDCGYLEDKQQSNFINLFFINPKNSNTYYLCNL